MRKLINSTYVTLDGVIDNPMWTMPFFSEEAAEQAGLVKAGLVDEVRFWIHPVLVGGPSVTSALRGRGGDVRAGGHEGVQERRDRGDLSPDGCLRRTTLGDRDGDPRPPCCDHAGAGRVIEARV
ncbi:hypothetical protein [Actinoplanes sp. NBRC 103695]|uniref:hypothetical protein n=1 Tax=Actinoplanes sp. NBRC 103695 TaxID=3032202 RepID=UPI0024A3968D|nr:hypothetical protein [Actinoplanes sp. NBRC 103695]GLZ00177.1 hypothetical protein Acsp02_74290 [Actinoplanes sp. NBRC 103695]